MCYANTLWNGYALDDSIVITQNDHTKAGVRGVNKLLTTDAFHGFFGGESNYVAGGRYRPLSMISFALEYQLFGETPALSHLINVLLYACLCMLIFSLLRAMIPRARDEFLLLAVILFVVHPVHTEVVANIKGRDEILCFLFALLSWKCSLIFFEKSSLRSILLMGLYFFLALLSKENAVSFLLIIPLSLYFFRELNLRKGVIIFIGLFIPFLLFMVTRHKVIGATDLTGTSMELMNNPFVKLESNVYVPYELVEKVDAIGRSMLEYLRLMVYPHPLTHDYYPRFFDTNSSLSVIAGIGIFLFSSLFFISVLGLRQKKYYSFGILFFLISIGIYLNIIFSVGTLMSERFLFIPSLGFILLVIFLLKELIPKTDRIRGIVFYVVLALIVLFSAKTITRNAVWKNNFTLFTTDVAVSHRSAKANNAAGGVLIDQAVAQGLDHPDSQEMLERAMVYLDRAQEIHPLYRGSYLLEGNAACHLKKYAKAQTAYETALRIDPGHQLALDNMLLCGRQGAEYLGKSQQKLTESLDLLKRIEKYAPNDPDLIRLLGVAHGVSGDIDRAISYMEKSVQLQPNSAYNYYNLGSAYFNSGRKFEAEEMFVKAETLEPGIVQRNRK